MPDRVERPRLGFLGTGRMGTPMCRNLLRAGYRLVVFNRTAERAQPLLDAGARWAGKPAEVAAQSDVVLACLGSVAASEALLLGGDGVAGRLRPGMLVVDHGTIGPDTARSLATRIAERGAEFLDAPVSGGSEGAQAGTLTIMVGGSASAFLRAEPILRAYGRLVVRVGDAGSGSLLKLVNQLLTFVHGATAAEAITLARRAGLDLDLAGEVLRQSFGQSRMLERTLPRVRAGDFEAGAALRLYAKDLELVLGAGARVGAALPLAAAAQAILQRALAAGLTDRDLAALYLLYEQDSSGTS
jgi:3-hydroxyisobutyrate dehydrogenase-like beta-hydroxyacid dehydrogenase